MAPTHSAIATALDEVVTGKDHVLSLSALYVSPLAGGAALTRCGRLVPHLSGKSG